jgi:hypothetical protein
MATDDLKVAVNAAIALERPLLVKGEPGTGGPFSPSRSQRGRRAADRMARQIDHQGAAGLYEYDETRLRDSQLGDIRVKDIRNTSSAASCGTHFTADERPVLLIDEIDVPTSSFNDLLLELDRMEFFVYETGETIKRGGVPRRHHLQQREGAARRLCGGASSTTSGFDADTSRAIIEVHSRHRTAWSPKRSLFYDPRRARHEEEAVDVGAARLACSDGRRHRPRHAAERDPKKLDPGRCTAH